MFALAVAGPDFPGFLDLHAGEGVDEGGFAGPGGTQQHEGAAWREMAQEFVEAVALFRGGGDHRDAGGLEDHLADDVVRQVREVRLGDDDQRGGSRVPGGDEGAFEPVVGERPVHGHHDADDVHVGAEDLRLRGGVKGAFAAQFRVARQNPRNGGLPRGIGSQPDPVAGGGQLPGAGIRQMEGRIARGDQDQVAVHADDPARAGAARHGMGREPFGDGGGEAVACRTRGKVVGDGMVGAGRARTCK